MGIPETQGSISIKDYIEGDKLGLPSIGFGAFNGRYL